MNSKRVLAIQCIGLDGWVSADRRVDLSKCVDVLMYLELSIYSKVIVKCCRKLWSNHYLIPSD